jgi:hypothetical protein
MVERLKTGQKVRISGQYSNNKGNSEITLVKGKTVPPSKGSPIFSLVDKTKHKK